MLIIKQVKFVMVFWKIQFSGDFVDSNDYNNLSKSKLHLSELFKNS